MQAFIAGNILISVYVCVRVCMCVSPMHAGFPKAELFLYFAHFILPNVSMPSAAIASDTLSPKMSPALPP